MAGITTVANQVRADVYAQLQTLGIDSDAIWENTGGDPPAVGSGTFFRVSVDFAQSTHLTSGWTRVDGAVIFQCYDDLNQGPERVEALAESIKASLQRRRLDDLFLYRRLDYIPVGTNDELGRYQGNLRVEFTRFLNE